MNDNAFECCEGENVEQGKMYPLNLLHPLMQMSELVTNTVADLGFCD